MPEVMRIGVSGAGGRMGATVCRAVTIDPELELVAAVDPGAVGEQVEGVTIAGEPKAFADAATEVVVDFTVADAARTTVPWLAMHGIHAVVGTTGLTNDDLALFAQEFGRGGPNCVVAPNFSLSAVVMMRLAEIAAPYFDTAEIIELHHDGKADAPSGTALATADRMAAASDQWGPDPTRTEVLAGARGGAGAAGIRIHAVRMRGMVAHQEVILGALGQSLTIRQDSYDRDSYMPGVILACKHVAEHDGLTVGLDKLLGLS
jgi:4-hydroxy-tetrahydrodipicolinate reductase